MKKDLEWGLHYTWTTLGILNVQTYLLQSWLPNDKNLDVLFDATHIDIVHNTANEGYDCSSST